MNLTSAPAPVPYEPVIPVGQPPAANSAQWQAAPPLPWWVAATILAGLVGFSTVMVLAALLVVWLLPRPLADEPATVAAPSAPLSAPVEPAPPPTVEPPLPLENEAPLTVPHDPIKLARRMPSSAEEQAQRPELERQPEVAAPAKPVAANPAPALQMPLKWAVEPAAPSKRDETNLIMPIEIARVAQGNVHFTLRRLRFPDDP